jgi:hypothetical protein
MSSSPPPTIPLPVRSNVTWLIAFGICLAILAFALWGLEVFILDERGAQHLCENARPTGRRGSGLGILLVCLVTPKELGIAVWAFCAFAIWLLWRPIDRLFDGIPVFMFDERSLIVCGWCPTIWSAVNWFEIKWADITGLEGVQVWNRGNWFMPRYSYHLVITAGGKSKKAKIDGRFLKKPYGEAMLQYLAQRRPDLSTQMTAALNVQPPAKRSLFRRAA